MYNKKLLNELDSLKRKNKESERYYILPYKRGYITKREVKNALLICYGFYFGDEDDIPSLYLRQTHLIRSEHFLKYGQFSLAREFCRKEYEDSVKALELLEKIIKETEEEK